MIPDTLNIAIGDSAPIRAQPVDASGAPLSGLSLFWSTSDSTIVSVDQTGMVRAVALGSANIDASIAGVSPKRPARIVVVATPVATIVIAPRATSLHVGGSFQFADTCKDAAGHLLRGRSVVWTSSDTTVAPVDQAGLVLGKSPGSATITVSAGSAKASATVTVNSVAQGSVASVAVSIGSNSIGVGQTTVVTAVSKDAAGNVLSGRVASWSSNKSSSAAVSPGGIDPATQLDTATVTGVASGSPTITATASNHISGNVSLTVTSTAPSAIAGIALTPNRFTVSTHATQQVTAQALDATGHVVGGVTFVWTTKSGGTIASVDGAGQVTGVAPGGDSVFASVGGITGGAAASVILPPIAKVIVSPSTATITNSNNASVQLTATLEDAHGNPIVGPAVTWSSDNPDVAVVSSSGVVMANDGGSHGTATIRATSQGVQGTATVTVVDGGGG
jgi:uncharacterized protein YjdB